MPFLASGRIVSKSWTFGMPRRGTLSLDPAEPAASTS
jgi:hypothetical protein